ncbi:MAG: MaoC/PaaZ C-terminal domain-containing protein [Myxococcota bacterium]|nr:MaoC/PaaZ C-terminal domain-containing protein [Myxococcota bacterium]
MPVLWSDVEPGKEPEPIVVGPLTRTDVVRYQGASGDMNPIHHDEPFATDAGYPAPLVVGMFPAGVLNTWATNWLGPENIRRTRVRWRAQVWPGDTLTFGGTVTNKYEEAGEKRVDLELVCQRGDDVVLQVWSTFSMGE